MSLTENKPNFFDMEEGDLQSYMVGLGKERYRAQQVFKWVYRENETCPEQMTNLSKTFRTELPKLIRWSLPELVTHHKSVDGTQKFLFRIATGETMESVVIPSEDRLTLCVSSEVGCNMACKFCFTAKQKLKRRLSAGEIVGQLYAVQAKLEPGQRISNIVFMGMGEPLDNSDAVFKSIRIMHSTWGFNLSRKKITVSTSGIVPEIHKVTEAGVRLAVSLNAVDDETRSKIMPINRRWPIAELLEACKQHALVTKEKVTLEYVLLKGITDSLDHARKLVKLTQDLPCKINIIPFNEHPNSGFLRPPERHIVKFQEELLKVGVHALRRKTMGRDIYAACGQLTSVDKNHPMSLDS